jgi:hypothetical protein
MFTRDISLFDCLLDLIDNSIDGYIRQNELGFDADWLFSGSAQSKGKISLTLDADRIAISDNCGGIDRNLAIKEVFNFVHSSGFESANHQLGAYGIGLKRALFKLGREFEITSRTTEHGFRMSVDLDDWVKKDSKIEDWTFPMQDADAATTAEEAGTDIVIRQLRPDIVSLLKSPHARSGLEKAISQAYAFFLGRHIELTLDSKVILPLNIPVGSEDEVEPSRKSWSKDGVEVTLLATLAERETGTMWRAEAAGWYVLCNGRVVVAADKTELTGWGGGGLPMCHTSKHRGFIGIAMFTSKNPLLLPWTTTKRGLNRESGVFLEAKNQIAAVSRPVISFMDEYYSGSDEETEKFDLDRVRGGSAAKMTRSAKLETSSFRPKLKKKSTIKVQYDAEKSDIDAIKDHLGDAGLSATKIGLHTFRYFIRREGLK